MAFPAIKVYALEISVLGLNVVEKMLDGYDLPYDAHMFACYVIQVKASAHENLAERWQLKAMFRQRPLQHRRM